MKVRLLLAAPLAAAFALSMACGDQASDPVGQDSLRDVTVPDLSKNILIAYEQTVYIESEGISVTFREFSDSRCPKGAVCVWEGEGIVELIISPRWLGRFRFGPLEWLWRTLTYGSRQPMRKAAVDQAGNSADR